MALDIPSLGQYVPGPQSKALEISAFPPEPGQNFPAGQLPHS